jgi:rhomboid family GlyGly-CTERM serine protease
MKTTISLTLLTLAAALIPGSSLELQRGGAVWRIVTGHFTHFTYEQLAWDALVFLILGIACARHNRGAFQATLLASIIVVPIAVLAFAPDVTTYRGLSGIDSALFALLLTMESRRSRLVALCAIGFAMKLLFEMTTGATVFVSAADFAPVPVAHLAGAIVGLVIGIRLRLTSPPNLFGASEYRRLVAVLDVRRQQHEILCAIPVDFRSPDSNPRNVPRVCMLSAVLSRSRNLLRDLVWHRRHGPFDRLLGLQRQCLAHHQWLVQSVRALQRRRQWSGASGFPRKRARQLLLRSICARPQRPAGDLAG